jgi:uncharacterized membrane protein
MFKSKPNNAISQRLNRSTLPNNEAICDLQARTIGNLERQYAAGEISEREYRQRYGVYAQQIREMGR